MAVWGGHQGTGQVVITWTFLSISFVVLVLRIITRVTVVKRCGLEDWVICIAFVFSVAYASLVIAEVAHGQGLHDSELPPSDVYTLRKILWFAIPCYITALTLTKISILLQYQRIFLGTAMQRICISLICFVLAYGIYSVIGAMFICGFTFANTTHCLARKVKWFSDAGINIVTDFILLILPMPSLKSLKIPTRQKFELIFVFALGAFVCVVSMVRLKYLLIIATSNDTAGNDGPAAYFSSLEISVGIICASLPILRPTFVRLVRRIWPRNNISYDTTYDEEKPKEVIPLSKRNAISASPDGMPDGMPDGILRVVTIITRDERRDSTRRPSLFPPDKMWDGGGGYGTHRSWVDTHGSD
ncbi:hypothetical protein MBLNU459_g1715t1 [Dothideomycetes sp. NU459]